MYPPTTPDGFTFYLGTVNVKHLVYVNVPLFLTRNILCEVRSKRPCRSNTIWALDSGGYKELDKYGRWVTSAATYASEVAYWYHHIPGMQWAAIQDWVCTPDVIEKTGLTVAHHQRNTINSYLKLTQLQPTLPWVPVIQGWGIGEYIDHVYQYEEAGIKLSTFPIVGIGSIARRQGTERNLIEALIREIASMGISLHGFGVKSAGLARYAHLLKSSDSIAWRHRIWERNFKSDKEEVEFALDWRQKVLDSICTTDPRQPSNPNDPIRLRRK